MTDYKYPPPGEPAEQPHNPGGQCYPLPSTDCPIITEPGPCPPDPYHRCNCPPRPPVTTSCLEDLIESQTRPITEGDRAKVFKAELEGFLAKARTAIQEYTPDKHKKLVEQWVEQDKEIVELVRKLVCAVPCWRCVIECHVCPLLYDMRDAELRLFRSRGLPSEVQNLHEQLFCQTQDRAAKERTFNRIKAVLTAWEKPAQTVEKALTDNAKLIADSGRLLGSEAPRVVFDVFLRLVPLHLAIAPPRGSQWKTTIARRFTELCHCDTGMPDYCCGPDVGELSLRERIIGPQPYLIDPNDYVQLICCLVEHRYTPAKDALSRAQAAVTTTENLIKRYKGVVENGLKNFNRDARAAIPATVDCRTYEPAADEPSSRTE